MIRWVSAFLACVALAAPAKAQTVTTAERSFTADTSAAIDRLAQHALESGRGVGLAIAVVEDGRIVYGRGFGFANLGKRTPVDADTEFYVGSLTMQFTAAAALLLAQDGKIKLDDKVVKYVPELTIAPDVTINQLLTQTSGLPDYRLAPGISNDQTHSIKWSDLIAAVDKMKPAATPGSTYENNDLNYMLAGMVVERAGGVPLSDFLQQNIFLPLIMDRTFMAGDVGISPTRAVGYTFSNLGFIPAKPYDPTWLLGARGLVSTVYDIAKWDLEMPILLRVDAVRTMFTPSGTSGPTQYGMGWVIDRRNGKLFTWYNGEIAGYRAMNAVLPDDHVAVVVFSNADTMHGGRVALPETIAARILDIVEPPVTTRLDNAIIMRAREWLTRLADHQIDRTQLTPDFSTYLTDKLVAREDFAALGKLETIVPISSTTQKNGDTIYEFLVRYPHDVRYHYRFGLTKDNKIDDIELVD
jgi:CubicO group peptidase (beta-lactamase class C family)